MRELAVAIQNENKNVNAIETIHSIKKAGFKNVFVQWYDENWEIPQQKQVDLCKELGLPKYRKEASSKLCKTS